MQLPHAETVAGQGIDTDLHVTEFVIRKRPDYPLRKGACHVLEFAADMAPGFSGLVGTHVFVQEDIHQ